VITLPGDDGGTITLQGVTSTDITADIFEFLAVDDTLTGTTADEIITGAYGDDTMTGGGGAATPSCSHPATATTRSPISARLTTRST
jgi:Ca2+-binding RTX toxin-like protein